MKQLYLLLFFMGTFSLAAQHTGAVAGNEEARIRVHPNPATADVVYVESDSNAPKTVRVFDLFGKVVLERRLMGDALVIDRLVPGVYMVRIEQNGKYATKKLVVR
ncbi:T9SS type A sorting domain-containing protein [Robiginitalea sp. SC105]|uniref:T9SS type A sorting domain-containing protein n=1 Tax=Robiginitalea sp. SC105 TaxID=2762332 RepID=UPI00163ACCA2|nr:T9SS type A sorting domain-containing protein [Robiginitalea sp. SC105]MBC2837903.1 T9SS type A sorting domain-containing protein [Robiginitalea sp. SC105]